MRAPFTRLAFAAIVLAAQAFSLASEAQTTPDQRSVAQVAAAIDADPKLTRLLGQCPAPVYRRAKENSAAADSCDSHLGECLTACRNGDGEQCFKLGLAIQKSGEKPLHAQIMFTAACANGKGSGCTNRGAGMRNGDYDGDPFAKRSKSAREQCQFRSFRTACGLNDAWGCAMLAQAYANGEGVKRSRTDAQRASDKSCELAPNFAACESGRSFIRR